MTILRKIGWIAVLTLAISSASPSRAHAKDWEFISALKAALKSPKAGIGFHTALSQNLMSVLRAYSPQSAEFKVTELNVVPRGPRGLPRITFLATKTVIFSDKSVVVSLDVKMRKIDNCAQPAGAQGYQLELNTQDSSKSLTDNVSALLVDACVVDKGAEGIEIHGTNYIKKGPSPSTFHSSEYENLMKGQANKFFAAIYTGVQFFSR